MNEYDNDHTDCRECQRYRCIYEGQADVDDNYFRILEEMSA